MTWEPTPQELDDFLLSSQATYKHNPPEGFTAFIPDQTIVADGFYGAAYINEDRSELIIAFEGTVPNLVDTYGRNSLLADLSILHGGLPAAVTDATNYADSVLLAASEQGIPQSDVFVTGHSLGGLEAEAVAATSVDDLHGATFGAPGLPGYSNTAPVPNLVDYVDYGDPVGNFSLSPATPMDHVGQFTPVGSPADRSSLEVSLLLAALATMSPDNPIALELAGTFFGDALKYHSLPNNYVPLLSSSPPPPLPTLTLSGSVTGSISVGQDADGNPTYSLASISPDLQIATVEVGVPTILPVSSAITGDVEYWSSPLTWPNSYVAVAGAIDIYSIVAGITSGDLGRQVSAETQTLASFGPTFQSVEFTIDVPLVFGLSASVGVSADLTYDVTISTGSDIIMDQADVDIDSLSIDPGGTLSAGSGGFTIDTYLDNEGSLAVVPGPGGSVGEALFNSGTLEVDGALDVKGPVFNSGRINVLSDYSFGSQPVDNVGGTIDVGLGALAGIDATLIGGTVEALSSGTVDIGFGGTMSGGTMVADVGGTVELDANSAIVGVVLSGSGSFQLGLGIFGAPVYYSYGSVLQNVTLANGVTLTAPDRSLGALRSDIVNAGTLLASLGTVVIDGGVTLSGGGGLLLAGGMILTADDSTSVRLANSSADPDALVNMDNSITGQGQVGFDYPIALQLINESAGTIDANVTGQILSLDAELTNQGVMRASNDGTLFVVGAGTVDNTGGSIEAVSGGVVEIGFQSTLGSGTYFVNSGTVLVDGGGEVSGAVFTGSGLVQGGSVSPHGFFFYGDILQDITLQAGVDFEALATSDTVLRGTINNAGTFTVAAGGVLGGLVIDDDVTLTGGGQMLLEDGSDVVPASASFISNVLDSSPAPDVLTNVDNTIHGAGGFADFLEHTLQLVNRAGGTIAADATGKVLLLGAPTMANAGIIEATGRGTLVAMSNQINDPISLDNNGGTVEALSGGVVEVGHGTTLDGGTIITDASGTVQIDRGGTIVGAVVAGNGTLVGGTEPDNFGSGSMLQDSSLEAGVIFVAGEQNDILLRGTIANSGTLITEGSNFTLSGEVALMGGGDVVLNEGGLGFRNLDSRSAPSDVLINIDNTIRGASGMTEAGLTNQNSGIIAADVAGAAMFLNVNTITNRGLLRADDNGTLLVGESTTFGVIYVDNSGGTIEALSSGVIALQRNGMIVDGTVIVSSGTVQIGTAGTLADAVVTASQGGAIVDDGLMEATAGNTLTVNGAISGFGELLVAGTMELDGSVDPDLHLVFDPGALILGAPLAMNATIEDFTADDSIRLAGSYTSLTASFSNGTLAISGDGSLIADLAFAGAYTTDDFSLSQEDGSITVNTDVPCFAAGTHVLTTRGEIRVEALRIGDMAITTDGTPRAVTWIGRRRIDILAHPRPDHVQPIRIRRHSLADGVPHRDLLVSPDHAIYLDRMLIPSRLLLNGATIIRDESIPRVEYFHVELGRHSILLAEGLPAESYLDTGNRAVFENATTPLILHPDFGTDDQRRRETGSCAPLVTDAAVVEPIWRTLADRAASLGYSLPEQRTTNDPELRIIAGGRTFAPLTTNDRRYTFVLPRSAHAARLVSRAAAPCDTRPWIEDRRRLGVMVRKIVVREGAMVTTIAMDDPRLAEGWWAAEHDTTALWRWTDGDAMLPITGGPLVVEVSVGDTLSYPVTEAAESYQPAQILTVAHSLVPIERMQAGSSINQFHASANQFHASARARRMAS